MKGAFDTSASDAIANRRNEKVSITLFLKEQKGYRIKRIFRPYVSIGGVLSYE